MSIDVLLVRHGEAAAQWGVDPDPGLSEMGKRQAAATAEALTETLQADTAIVSSPMCRARDTAAYLAGHFESDMTIDDRFREVPAPVPFEDRATWIRTFMTQQWSAQPQTIRTWRDQILAALESLTAPTVVFTHFVVINAVVSAIEQTDAVMVFQPDYASVTRLRLEHGKLHIVHRGDANASIVN